MADRPTRRELEERILELEKEVDRSRRLERELLATRQKFKDIVEFLPDPTFAVDNERRIVIWNRALREMTGLTEEEMIGRGNNAYSVPFWGEPRKALADLFLDDDPEADLFSYDFIEKSGESWIAEAFLPAFRGGEGIHVWLRASPVYDENGNLAGVIETVRDITDRKRDEKALGLSRQKLDLHFKQTPLAVMEWDPEFRVRSWNPAAERMFGYSEEEMTGRSGLCIVPDGGRGQVGDVWAELLKHKGGSRSTNRNITRNGEVLFCEWFNTPIVNEAGEIIAVFSLAQNITDRKRAEERLQIERDKLRSVINGIGDAMYIVNRDYIVDFQNNLAKEQFGDLVGRRCYRALFNRETPCDFCLMHETIRENRVRQVETDALGSRNYDIIFSPFREAKKETKSVVVLRDITEKKSLRAEAERAGRLASLGELAAGVAHEINNPVTAIISIAEVLGVKFHELGGNREIPDRIVREGERIGKIVSNLLSFARCRKEAHAPVHIAHIFEATLELVEKQLHKDGIHLSVDLAPGIPEIRARSHQLQQVLLNIISNGRYALNRKYPGLDWNKKLDIRGEATEGGERRLRLTFHDRGTGIPPNLLNKLTDPFFTTKPHGEGTGLGLSISQGIINNHGGRLGFRSSEGEYTKVIVELPFWSDDSKEETP